MGDIKRKRKQFSRPRKLYDAARIAEENKIVEKYGLKNKREIWKAESVVSDLRRRAKLLIPKSEEEKAKFFEKLNKMGFTINNIADVLALNKENFLERRLQTIVFKKGLVKTPKQARQLIVHKHVLVEGKAINAPSYWVTVDVENKITVKPQKQRAAKVIEEVKSEGETPNEQ